jgi:tetratricopeptide (TPR) repeat protein
MMTSTRRQPHRIPPPITWGVEPFEGEPLLAEVGGDLGLLLFRTLRSLDLWAGATPRERSRLFSEGAHRSRMEMLEAVEIADDARPSLVSLARALQGNVDAVAMAGDCESVAAWAEGNGWLRTATEFTQISARLRREVAGVAIEVGRLSWATGDLARAETWFREAVVRGRRMGDWRSFGFAHLSLGNLLKERGSLPMAQRSAIRALRSARRNSLTEIVAMAHHALAELAIEGNREREVVEQARRALDAYGPRHPRVPALANDVAYHWMSRGYFPAALEVFQALAGSATSERTRLFLAANTARAAAGAGEPEAFEAAWAQALQLLEDPRAASGAAAALLDLGRGAATLSSLQRAREVASRALAIAESEGKQQIRLEAESLLASIAAEEAVEVARKKRTPRPVTRLAAELSYSLQPA